MAASTWTFVLTKLDHTVIGEVQNAYDRTANIALSRPSTASFTIRQDNARLASIFNEDTLLQVYQDSICRFWGPNVSANFGMQGNTKTVAINAVDPAWRLSKRLAGKSSTGDTYGSGKIFSGAKDKGIMAKEIVDKTNTAGETGIETTSDTCGSTGGYIAGPYKPVLDCIGDLAHGIGGFDWYIEPKLADASKIGKLRLAGVVGSEKPNAIFEYGVGKNNVSDLSLLRDLGGVLTKAYHIPDEGLEGTEPVLNYSDATAITERGLYEETVDLSGVSNEELRKQWLTNNVEVRKKARMVLGMTAAPYDASNPTNVPQPGTDYWLGDLVPARAVTEGLILFNGLTRVWGISVSVNDAGTAVVTPSLVKEG